MGLIFRKRVKTSKNGSINLSKSGASYSHRIGPFTINSRGRISIRLGNGFSWRIK